MKPKIKPMREYLLIEHFAQDDSTDGGIIIPVSARETQRKAKVLAVGDGWVNEKTGHVTPLGLKVGDIVLIGSNMEGVPVEFKGKKYELIRENYIFGTTQEA